MIHYAPATVVSRGHRKVWRRQATYAYWEFGDFSRTEQHRGRVEMVDPMAHFKKILRG